MADDVSVKFGAQIDGLVAGVNAAKESIESIATPINEISNAFSGLAEVAGAAFVFDGIAEAIGRYAEMGEQIERTAKITGSSAGEVQEFQFAIKMSGGDAETAGASLQRFGRNIADASKGTGTAAEAFKNLGISVTNSAGQIRPVMDVLGDVADRFSKTQDGATKLEYAIALGGRAFGQMIPYLDQGREGLERLRNELEATGAKMAPDQVERAEQLKQGLNVLDSSWQGLKNTLADEAAPAFSLMVDLSADLVQGINNAAKAAANSGGIFHSTFGALGSMLQILHNQSKMAAMPPSGAHGGYHGEPEGGMSMADMYSQSLEGVGEEPKSTLNPLSGAAAADNGKDTQSQIDRSDYQTALEIDKLKLRSRKDTDEAMVASGRMTSAQQIADLQQMATQEYALEVQAVDNLARTYDSDSAEYAELQNKKLVLAQEFSNEQAKLAEQLAAAQKKQYDQELAPWKSLMGDMGGAFDTMINGVLSGTQTWKQALSKSYDDLGIKFTEVIAKMTAEYAVFRATSGKGVLGFGTTNPFAALGGPAGAAGGLGGNAAQTANTTALTALNANFAALEAALGINTTTHASGTVAVAANTTASVGLSTSNAAGTLATTENTLTTQSTGLLHVAAMAENTIATAANTIATWVESAMASFDVGSYSVPNDMVAKIHQGEMIIPASQAAQIRSGNAMLGASAGGVSGGGAGSNFTINISAIDTQTGMQFLKNNAAGLAAVMAGQSRNFNSNAPGWKS